MERTIGVRLEVTGAGTFRDEMLSSAQTVKGVGTAAVETEAEATRAGGAVSKLGDVGRGAISSFLGFAGAQAAIAAGTQIFGDLRKEIFGVDDALTKAAAIMEGVTPRLREEMLKTAQVLSVQYGLALTDVVGVYRDFAEAGLNAEQSVAALPAVVEFSKASLLDLSTAATTAIGVQTSFGLRSKDAVTNARNLAHVTDVLTLAANSSNASIQGISEAMQKAGPIGAGLGLSIEQVSAVLADMADKGFNGRRALLAFTQLFQELPAKAGALKNIGIDIFTSTGALQPMSKILGELQAKFGGLTVEQRNSAFASLGFSSATQKVLLALLPTGDAVKRYEELLHHADGTTQSVAEKSMKSLLARAQQLRAELLLLGSLGFEKLVEFGAWLEHEFEPALKDLGTIGAAAASALAPIGAGVLAAGATAGRVGIQATATALNTMLGLLASNKTLIEVLAAVFATKLAVAAAGAAIELGTVIAVQLADWAIAGAAEVSLLVTQLEAAEGASGALSVVWGRFGGAIAFGGVALGVAGIVTNLMSANDQSTRLVDSLTKKPTGAGDTLSVLRSNVAGLSKELDGLYRTSSSHANPLGFLGDFASQIGDLGLSIIGKGDVINSPLDQLFDKSKVAAAKKNAQEMIDTIRGAFAGIRAQLVDKSITGSGPGPNDMGPFTDAELHHQQFNARALVAISKLTDQSLGDLAQNLGLDLTAPTKDWLPELTSEAAKLVGLAPAAQATAIAFDAVNNSADIGTKKIDAYKSALDALFAQTFGVSNAQDSLQSSLNAVTTAAQNVTKGGGSLKTSMTDTSDTAISLRGALSNVVQQLDAKVVADGAAGKSGKQVRDDINQQIVAFVVLAQKAGLPKDAIDKIVSAMEDVKRHPLDAKTDPATKKLTDVKKAVKDLDTAKAIPHVGLSGDVQVTQRVNDLLAKIKSLGSIDVHTTISSTTTTPTTTGAGYGGKGSTGTGSGFPGTPGAGGIDGNPNTPQADGGLVYFADGGSYGQSSKPIAQIAPAGAMRVWAEPETGGEAYIPLSPSKRGRSFTILEHVAELFGYEVMPRHAQHFAEGGIMHTGAASHPDTYNVLAPESLALSRRLEQYANEQLVRLRGSFGPLGAHPFVQFVSDRQMLAEYAGCTLYGQSGQRPDAVANGDATSGRIQVNRDLMLGMASPYESLRIAINKEWAQTVLPHFLSSDAKIRKYFDIIGYHPRSDAHLVDDLWSGAAKIGGLHTTPADLFGYFAAHSVGGGDFPADFAKMPARMVERLRAAGLIPGAYKDPSQRGLEFLAEISKNEPDSATKRALASLVEAGRWTDPGRLVTRDGRPEVIIRGGRREFADGGFSQSPKHEAQVAPAGAMRLWAEPETGGEAYIPLSRGKRARSVGLLAHVAEIFGYDLTAKGAHALVSAGLAPAPAGMQRFASGGFNAGVPILQTQTYEQNVARTTSSIGGTASGAAAVNAARGANPATDAASLAQQNAAIAQTLDQIARTYQDVAAAAGKSAADQLAASGLVGAAYDAAAQKIIAAAQAQKQAEAEVTATRQRLVDEDFTNGKIGNGKYLEILQSRLGRTKKFSADWLAIHDQIAAVEQQQSQTRRTLQDDEYQRGKMSADSYVALLHRRLAETVKYSAAWLTIMQQIEQVQADKVSKVQTQFNSFAQPTQSQTDLVGALGTQTGVTGQMVGGFLANAVAATKEFQSVTQELLSKGFDKALVEEVMRAGPKALPFAKALLTLPVAQVNAQEHQLAVLGAAQGAAGVKAFGNVDRSVHLTVGGVKIDFGGAGTHGLTQKQVTDAVHAGIREAAKELHDHLNAGATAPAG